MRFTKVNEVPKVRRSQHKLKDDLERFIASGMKIAKIDFHADEYKSASVAVSCLSIAIKRHGFNGIKVFRRGNDVYLQNDM